MEFSPLKLVFGNVYFIFIYVHEDKSVYMHVHKYAVAHKTQKMAMDSLELEL